MVVEYLNEALNQFAISVHSVLIESIIEVVSELLILSFPISRISEVILVEGVLENILGLD
jgi:hypothetical protein